DELRRLQALHAGGLPRRVPDGGDLPHRARHRRDPGRRLQRLRLLRHRMPLRRDREARDRRRRRDAQVHALLRPPPGRARARVRGRRGARRGRGAVVPRRLAMSVSREYQPSYYGRPIVKEPVWKTEIPTYFFTGGLAGTSASLALAARLAGNDTLARRALWVNAAAITVSPLLLIKDLGRPLRFLNMLRVFKVTSPMSVGTWIVSFSGTATGTAAACEL